MSLEGKVALVTGATSGIGLEVRRLVEETLTQLGVFLCSAAASQIRGASLSIDGGWTAQ